jgi:hypothetical protein
MAAALTRGTLAAEVTHKIIDFIERDGFQESNVNI